MRYLKVDLIEFLSPDGRTVQVHDLREIPTYNTRKEIQLNKNDRLDEIAARPDIFGDNGEMFYYMLIDHNFIEILENDFSITKLNTLRIPENA